MLFYQSYHPFKATIPSTDLLSFWWCASFYFPTLQFDLTIIVQRRTQPNFFPYSAPLSLIVPAQGDIQFYWGLHRCHFGGNWLWFRLALPSSHHSKQEWIVAGRSNSWTWCGNPSCSGCCICWIQDHWTDQCCLVLALTLGCSTSAYNCRGSVFSDTMNNWPSAQLHTQTHPRCNINHSAHISVAFVVSEMEVAIVSHSVLDKQRCNWRSSVIE